MHLPPRVEESAELIGNTPLLQLPAQPGRNKPRATIWGKCEMYNPGGSMKDRAVLSMIEAAERRGELNPGDTLVEATAGNTGISLALLASQRGYRAALSMPENTAPHRKHLLRRLGAELVLTPSEQTMEGAIDAARELSKRPGHYRLEPFDNPDNPEAHYRTTGAELLRQMEGLSVDAFVMGVGTGGTLTGVGRRLRERFPDVLIAAVEPDSSPVLSGGAPGPHRIDGLGAGFVPPILDTQLYDRVYRVSDDDAQARRQQLCAQGLIIGVSSGANVVAAQRLADELPKGRNVVTILCDDGARLFPED